MKDRYIQRQIVFVANVVTIWADNVTSNLQAIAVPTETPMASNGIMEMPKNSSIGMEQRYVVKEYDTLSINKIFIIDKDLI